MFCKWAPYLFVNVLANVVTFTAKLIYIVPADLSGGNIESVEIKQS